MMIEYPTKTKEEWTEFFDGGNVIDCTDDPYCPLHLEDEEGSICAILLMKDDFEDETCFEELCCRINMVRKLVQSSNQTAKKVES